VVETSGVVATTVWSLTTRNVAWNSPRPTAAVLFRCFPVIVTSVPPVTGPVDEDSPDTDGG